VTFWGVEYFKSFQDKEVLFGTTLYWPLMRQVSAGEKETVDQIESILRWFSIATMLFILPVITAGSMLPTWMFINSVQIIAHMALLKTLMPGNAHYFLNKYLDWLRWRDADFIEWLQVSYDFNFKSYSLEKGSYHALLNACGYEHLFA